MTGAARCVRGERRRGFRRWLRCFRRSPGSGANGSAQPDALLLARRSGDHCVARWLRAGGIRSRRRIVVMLFPPVSERDQPGIEELESQTTNLLSFRPIEQTVFDAQVAFNLLSGYGEESKPRLRIVAQGNCARRGAAILRPRAGARDSIGASAGFLRVCFRAYAEFASPAAAGATGSGVCESGREDGCGRAIPLRRT